MADNSDLVMLRDRFEIKPGTRLSQFDQGSALAYAVEDHSHSGRKLFALICSGKVPCRGLSLPERRAQILQAAAECFGTRGFRGTTTRDVAAAVGITEAALYRHFSGKEAIYAAILDQRIAAPEFVAHLDADARAGDEQTVFFGMALRMLESVEADPS